MEQKNYQRSIAADFTPAEAFASIGHVKRMVGKKH